MLYIYLESDFFSMFVFITFFNVTNELRVEEKNADPVCIIVYYKSNTGNCLFNVCVHSFLII